MVTDQGSNFVRLLKQKINKYIEEDNIDIVGTERVEIEIEEINQDLNEINESENLTTEDDEDADDTNEDDLKKEEGGIIPYLDDPEDENEQEIGFFIKLGILFFC